MKVCIAGAGAIGATIGVRLHRAGAQVSLLARGPHLEAIRRDGLRFIDVADGTTQAHRMAASASPAELGPQDLVVIGVKAYSLPALLPTLGPLLGPGTVVLPAINGVPWWYFQRLAGPYEGRVLQSVDPGGAIAAAIEPERVIGSIVYPATELVAPGHVRVIEGNRFTLGELDGSRSERIEGLSRAMMRAGFKAPVARDIRGEIWVKLWGNCSLNPISALTHATLEEICRFPASRALVATMMAEAQAVAEKLGVAFKISIDQRIAGAEAVGAHKTSMLVDVENGRAIELDALVGAVVELARITGTPTPAIDAIHAATALLAHTLAAQRGRLRVEAT